MQIISNILMVFFLLPNILRTFALEKLTKSIN